MVALFCQLVNNWIDESGGKTGIWSELLLLTVVGGSQQQPVFYAAFCVVSTVEEHMHMHCPGTD